MHVATLLTNPARADLAPALVETLRRAWDGDGAVWLAPDAACEFGIPSRPEDLARMSDELRARGVDVVVQPAMGRRKRMFLADMDSTMIAQECIDELAQLAGVADLVAPITARAMNGEIAFEGALRERVALLRGQDAAIIDRVWEERITMAPGARTLMATLRDQNVQTILVSGGFTAFTARVAEVLGFDEHHANRLLAGGGPAGGDRGGADPGAGCQARKAAERDGGTAFRRVGGAGGGGWRQRPGDARGGGHRGRAAREAGGGGGGAAQDRPLRPDGAAVCPGLFAGGVRHPAAAGASSRSRSR